MTKRIGPALLLALASAGLAYALALAPPLVYRTEWGARAPKCAMTYCSPWEHVTIHHSAGATDYDAVTLDDCKAVVRAIQAYHMDVNDWCDVGYNFLVCKHGDIFEGRDGSLEYRRGAHDTINCPGLGICGLGYFHEPYNQTPTAEMVDSIENLIAWQWDALGRNPYGTGVYGGLVENVIGGHRDVKATACPGDVFYDGWIGTNPYAGAVRDGVCAKMATCAPPPPPSVVHVAAISVAETVVRSGWHAVATVTIADSSDTPASGATVTVRWSGAHTGTSSGTTNDAGQVTLTSARAKKSGTTSACVTSVARPNGTYDPATNEATCGSITH